MSLQNDIKLGRVSSLTSLPYLSLCSSPGLYLAYCQLGFYRFHSVEQKKDQENNYLLPPA